MNTKNPEALNNIEDQQHGLTQGVEATISGNASMQGRLNQSPRPGATALEAQHPELFKANGGLVEKTAFRRGSNGNTIAANRGATALAAAKDMSEASERDAQDMEAAERIMDEVAEAQSEASESADDGGIPPNNPERDEVAKLSAGYTATEGEANATLAGIESETATALNSVVSGVGERDPDQMVQAD